MPYRRGVAGFPHRLTTRARRMLDFRGITEHLPSGQYLFVLTLLMALASPTRGAPPLYTPLILPCWTDKFTPAALIGCVLTDPNTDRFLFGRGVPSGVTLPRSP